MSFYKVYCKLKEETQNYLNKWTKEVHKITFLNRCFRSKEFPLNKRLNISYTEPKAFIFFPEVSIQDGCSKKSHIISGNILTPKGKKKSFLALMQMDKSSIEKYYTEVYNQLKEFKNPDKITLDILKELFNISFKKLSNKSDIFILLKHTKGKIIFESPANIIRKIKKAFSSKTDKI